jgi:hypothetical protein
MQLKTTSSRRSFRGPPRIVIVFAIALFVGLARGPPDLEFDLLHIMVPSELSLWSPPPVIAYVISLIKCGDHQTTIPGMMDAIVILRHSVHKHSIRSNPNAKYDYKFYALVHKDAEQCSGFLRDLGIEILIKDTPVKLEEMQSEVLRKEAPRAWCCGHAEFIKLYAYTLTQHPLVVHMDADFLLIKPMDIIFDSMLLSPDSERGKKARDSLPVEFPDENDPLFNPSWKTTQVSAMMTRDWGQVMPGGTRKPGFQAGFLIIRPNVTVFEDILRVVRTTDFVGGWAENCGWGGKGYGAFVGGAAMQGLLAYYYDEVAPRSSWVELNQCRFNHMGMDILYRAPPNYHPRVNPQLVGTCRNGRNYCEDCQTTDLADIYSIHYTQCRKPWACIGASKEETGDKAGMPADNVRIDHCLQLATVWHSYRKELEEQLGYHNFTNGTYMPEVFQGHCRGFGGKHYISFSEHAELRQRIPTLYGEGPDMESDSID